jgi:hypothetical protein
VSYVQMRKRNEGILCTRERCESEKENGSPCTKDEKVIRRGDEENKDKKKARCTLDA